MKDGQRILLRYNSWEFVKIFPNSPLLLTETWQSKIFAISSLCFTHRSFETPSPAECRLLQAAMWLRTHSNASPCAACPQISLSQPRARTELTCKVAHSSTRPSLSEAMGVETDTPADSPTIQWLQQFPHVGVSIGSSWPDPESCVHVGRVTLIKLLRVRRKLCACWWHNGGKQQLPAPTQSIPLLSALPSNS